MRNRNYILAIALFFAFFFQSSAFAITKQNADDSYKKGNYQQAIADYNELLRKGVSADIYYNLGNAYYRTDNLAQAILAYERALRLSPGDKDIRFNLQFASSKTIDKITPIDSNVFSALYKGIVNFTSVDNWARTAVISIIFALILILVYLFAFDVTARKVGFFGSAAFVVIFLLSNLFAYQQKVDFENSTGAVVMVPSVGVKASPVSKSADAFVLHEGTLVDITDSGMRGLKAIRLADGREGWVVASALELI